MVGPRFFFSGLILGFPCRLPLIFCSCANTSSKMFCFMVCTSVFYFLFFPFGRYIFALNREYIQSILRHNFHKYQQEKLYSLCRRTLPVCLLMHSSPENTNAQLQLPGSGTVSAFSLLLYPNHLKMRPSSTVEIRDIPLFASYRIIGRSKSSPRQRREYHPLKYPAPNTLQTVPLLSSMFLLSSFLFISLPPVPASGFSPIAARLCVFPFTVHIFALKQVNMKR